MEEEEEEEEEETRKTRREGNEVEKPGRRRKRRELCRDSYVGDVTSLLTIEKAIGRGRHTVLAGIGSAVLWYDPFCDDDDDDATDKDDDGVEKRLAPRVVSSGAPRRRERVHGMRREPMLDDAEGNRFGVVVWGEQIRPALALRVPTRIEEEDTRESASESDASSSSRTTEFECEFVVSIGQTFSHWVPRLQSVRSGLQER